MHVVVQPVQDLVVHLDECTKPKRREWRALEKELTRRPSPVLEQIHEEGWTIVYRLLP